MPATGKENGVDAVVERQELEARGMETDRAIARDAELLSAQLQAMRDRLYSPASRKVLRRFTSGEAARLFRRGVPAEGQFELLLKSREGERREMLVTVSPIALSERSGTILILKDVTVRERHSLDAAEYRQMIGGFGLAPLRLVLDVNRRQIWAAR